jgi:hypothetical protein
MAELGERLIANGYPILPIMPGAKCPGRFTRGHWTGYPDWSRHCHRETKAFELGVWRQWPGCAIGVACGAVVAFDVDILDQALSEELQAKALSELGDTPAIRIGLAPKRLLVYRAKEPFKPIKRHPLEMLATGSQFVAYGIHPDTQRPYSWTAGDELADIPASDLPTISEDQARAFLDAAFALVPPDMRRSTLGPDRSAEIYFARDGDLRGTLEAVADAIEWIPNDDVHYDDWVRIGMAIKGAVGEAGADLFFRWSARSAKDMPGTTLKSWQSFRPERIGAGTIYAYAQQYGWVPDAGLILNAATAERMADAHPAAKLIANGWEVPVPTPEPEPEPTPAPPLDSAPGMLGELVDWMTSTAVSPQPFLSLGAAMAAVGVLAGQRFRLAMPDTRSAIYIIALAESGGGKDHPRKCVRQLFGAAGLNNLLGGETLASGSALMSSLGQSPCRLFQVDEFGHFVAAVLDPKSHAHHRREIMTQLTTLWSSADTLVVGTEYANQKDRPRKDIQEPCACVYGSTVPLVFWNAMQSGTISDGSLARFLVMQAEENFPDERERPEDIGVRLFSLAARAKAINERQGTGSIVTIPLTHGAVSLDADIRAEQLAMKRANEGSQYSAIVARYREHVRRVALIGAVAAGEAQLSAGVMSWSRDLVRHCMDGLIVQAERYIADSEVEAIKKRVLEIVRQHGEISQRDLARKTQFLKQRDRSEVLNDLAEAGRIVIEKRQSGMGRPTFVISLAAEK